MTRRKLTTWIVAAALTAAVLAVALLERNKQAASNTPAAMEQGDQRPKDTVPTQVQNAPQSTQEVFMPPTTSATGSSPAPK